MSNADSRIPEKIEDSVIREKYVCDGKLNCQIRCPMCPSKILPIKSAKIVEFSKKLPGKNFKNHNWRPINPYWQILENSSRNCSKILVFWIMSQGRITGKLIQFFSKFRFWGHELDRISGKLIQQKFTSSVFLQNGS